MPSTAVTKPKIERLKKKDDMPPDAIAHLMNMDETKKYFYGPKKDKAAREQQLRLMALMCTIDPPVKVAEKFGVGHEIVRRAWRKYRGELQDATITRNKIVAGLAERRAIQALQSLDVTKIADDKKARTVKDLMDSSSLANENVKPADEKKDESTMELIFRIKKRGSTPLPKPSESEDDVVDGEFEETKQIPKETP